MKRIVEKLLMVLRTFLSRIGFSADSFSSTDVPLTKSGQITPSRSVGAVEQDVAREPVRFQSTEFHPGQATQESGGKEADEVIRRQSGSGLGVDSAASPAGPPDEAEKEAPDSAPDAAMQEPTAIPTHRPVSVDEDSTKVSDAEKFVSINRTNGDSSGPERTLQIDASELDSGAVPHGQSNDSPHKSDDHTIEEGAEATASLPCVNDTCRDLPSFLQLVGDETTDSREGIVASTAANELGAEVGETEMETADEKMGGVDQPVPHHDVPRMEGVQQKQVRCDLPANTDVPELSDSDAESAVTSSVASEDQYIRNDVPAGGETVPTADQIAQELTDSDPSLLDQGLPKPTAGRRFRSVSTEMIHSPRQPAPEEDAGEYKAVVRDISAIDQEYARWNSAIVEQLLLAKSATKDVYLCVNPRILAWAFAEAGFDVLTPDQAEQRFSAASANVYRKCVLGHIARLHVLRRCGDDGSPDCTAFLAASVLAAYRMQSDEEVSGSAYYKRLADLLGCEMLGAHPVGFSPPVFESLWVFLRNWLCETHKRQLAMPGTEVGLRRFVALPLAHVPLRSLDIEKLPAFFAWAGYEPGSRVRRDQLLADLRLWQQARNMLTPTGAEALSDDRCDAVLAQASAELDSWDGSFSESISRRSALVEIHFDIVQRKPILAYLPRRPSGFPGVFDDGVHVFEASDEGWYDPAPILPADGEMLASGFEWRSHVGGAQFTLRRSEALVVALTPSSSYSGFLSSQRLLRGVRCSVLCRNEVIGNVEEYLSEAAQKRLNAVSHPSLPKGWSIIRDFTAQVHIEAPPCLGALEIDPNIELLVSGGLRIGHRWSWLAGAPPRILVSGVEARDQVKVNGTLIKIGDDGELAINEILAQHGDYLIEAGRARRRIEVVSPQVSVHATAKRTMAADRDQSVRIALPQGSWTLIGSSPGQVCSSSAGFFQGTLASCSFRPTWAVQVSAGLGARVAALAKPEPPQEVELRNLKLSSRSVFARWASVVYDAHVRRPSFFGLNGIVPDEGIVLIWKQYAAVAKRIKRALKH